MKKVKAFTLIEIMVVVVILGILAVMIVPKVMGRPDQARMVKAKQDLLSLENALELYKLDNGDYPTTEQGLKSLVKKPEIEPVPGEWKEGGYVKRLPKDPWGHAYHYANPGEHGDIDLYSDGKKGTRAQAEDLIGNWNV